MGEAPDQLREDIEETRARMGERAEALAYKADVPARSKDKVHDMTDRIKEKVTGMGHSVSGTSTSAAGSVKDKAHGATDKVGDTAYRAKGLAESNPLGLAIGAIAAGFLAGLAIPATRVEQDKLGPVAEQARAKAQEVGGQVAERAKGAAHAAEDAVKDEVSNNS